MRPEPVPTPDWHQPGNLFSHLPEHKILTAIDTFPVKNASSFRLLLSHHLPAYFRATDQMLEYDVETVVTGHLSLVGTPEDVQTNREYIRDLRASGRRGAAHGGPEGGRCRCRCASQQSARTSQGLDGTRLSLAQQS